MLQGKREVVLVCYWGASKSFSKFPEFLIPECDGKAVARDRDRRVASVHADHCPLQVGGDYRCQFLRWIDFVEAADGTLSLLSRLQVPKHGFEP